MKENHKTKKNSWIGAETEELLERLANSPCASRDVPPTQSLEEYLRASEGRKGGRNELKKENGVFRNEIIG